MSIDLGKLLKGGVTSLVSLIPGIGPAAASLISGIDSEVANLSPEQRVVLEKAAMDAKVAELKTLVADNADFRKMVSLELQSEDAFVRRARPANLWLWIAIMAFYFMLLPIANGLGASIEAPDLSRIPEQAWWTYMVLFIGYTGAREYGKAQKLKNGR